MFREASAATVVPHDPAPMTATRIGMALTVIAAFGERSVRRGGARRYAAPAVSATTSAAVVVPVKAFGEAKVRLAGALDPGERARLARHMAEIVLLAAAPLPVVVVCDDDERAGLGRALGRADACGARAGG